MAETIDLKAAGAWVGRELPKELHDFAIAGLRLAAVRGLGVILTRIIPSRRPPPVDRGVYRAGWKHRPIADGAEIYNDERHAAFIENGVRAENVKIGRRMIQALEEWVLRKGLESTPAAARRRAWAIAQHARTRAGFFNRGNARLVGMGFQVLKELESYHLPAIVRAEVERQLARAGGGGKVT